MSGLVGLRAQRTVQCMETIPTERDGVDVCASVRFPNMQEITATVRQKKMMCAATENTVHVCMSYI